MRNIKRIIALNIIIIATLALFLAFSVMQRRMITHAENCANNTCAAFQKANEFSIVNILSLKFR